MIQQETMQHVAKLARLNLDEVELQSLTQDMENIVALVNQLQSFQGCSETEGTVQACEETTLLRKDEVRKDFSRDLLLNNAPEEDNGYFKVPKIIDEAK